MAEFNRVDSCDYFKPGNRLSMSLNLSTKKLSISYHGREATEEEIGTALWMYHQALNSAERQIEKMKELILYLSEDCQDDPDVVDYLENYPDLSKVEALDYKIEESREALFVSMFKGNDSLISKYANLLNIQKEKRDLMEQEVSDV